LPEAGLERILAPIFFFLLFSGKAFTTERPVGGDPCNLADIVAAVTNTCPYACCIAFSNARGTKRKSRYRIFAPDFSETPALAAYLYEIHPVAFEANVFAVLFLAAERPALFLAEFAKSFQVPISFRFVALKKTIFLGYTNTDKMNMPTIAYFFVL
jgi:hypothetical protein